MQGGSYGPTLIHKVMGRAGAHMGLRGAPTSTHPTY